MTAKTERADAIRWIQAQMDDYGLTLEELDAAGCFAPPPPPPEPPPPPPVCYRNAEGLTWDGQGEMPSWLKRAVNAGQSVEFFRGRIKTFRHKPSTAMWRGSVNRKMRFAKHCCVPCQVISRNPTPRRLGGSNGSAQA